jgi:hypothetical protein
MAPPKKNWKAYRKGNGKRKADLHQPRQPPHARPPAPRPLSLSLRAAPCGIAASLARWLARADRLLERPFDQKYNQEPQSCNVFRLHRQWASAAISGPLIRVRIDIFYFRCLQRAKRLSRSRPGRDPGALNQAPLKTCWRRLFIGLTGGHPRPERRGGLGGAWRPRREARGTGTGPSAAG